MIASAVVWKQRSDLRVAQTMAWLNAYLGRVKRFPALDELLKKIEAPAEKPKVTDETLKQQQALQEKTKQLYLDRIEKLKKQKA